MRLSSMGAAMPAGVSRQARNELFRCRHVPMREEVSGETVSAASKCGGPAA